MTMKIVQLETQDERSPLARQVFARQSDVRLWNTSSIDEALALAKSEDVDLLICSQSSILHESRNLMAELSAARPRLPVIVLGSREDRVELLRDPQSQIWDVIPVAELDRLPLSVLRAVESKRVRDEFEAEVSRLRDSLASCQKNVAVGRLLGSIAHEINNPLEVISNLLYLGQRNASDESKVLECLQLAEQELQHIGDITKQILHFHRDSQNPREVSLLEVIENVLILYRDRLISQNIRVSKQYRSHAKLVARPGEMRQAFANFVANALDAMPRGGTLNLRIRDDQRCKISVTIADTGHGMPREGLRRLGELLYTTKGESGTGLGLWVSYQIIAKYGGSIQVYSSMLSGRSGTVIKLCFRDSIVVRPVEQPNSAIEIKERTRRFGQDRPQKEVGECEQAERTA